MSSMGQKTVCLYLPKTDLFRHPWARCRVKH